jgi:hypothetical protein
LGSAGTVCFFGNGEGKKIGPTDAARPTSDIFRPSLGNKQPTALRNKGGRPDTVSRHGLEQFPHLGHVRLEVD